MTYASTHMPQARQHPDPIRIIAISASIALNAALIAVLMRPMEIAPPAAADESHPVTIIVPDLKPLIPPIIPIKPIPQTVHKATVQPIPHPQPQPVVTKDSTLVSIPFIPPTIIDRGTTGDDNTHPGPADASLIPLTSPPPLYPRMAVRDGITGTVELELLVGVDGHVLEARVTHSSGNRMLDNAARDQVLRSWLFKPAIRNGVAVQARGILPIAFTLDGR
ncbi:MAG: energy transducer TonB [Lysobacteraceae bacterium]